jgi:hypothetical protein
VILAIIVISTLPIVFEYVKARRRPKTAPVPHTPHVE